mgnify:CR=1 FL=1
MEQKQLDYYLKNNSGEHDREYLECMKEIFKERGEALYTRIWDAYEKEKDRIQDSFDKALRLGAQEALDRMEQGEKGPIRYLHFSYLLSNALAEEMLVKADYYDGRHFSDLAEVDCFWDYRLLFPHYLEERECLEGRLIKKVTGLTACERQRFRLYYQVWNFMELEAVIKRLMGREQARESLSPCLNGELSVYFGAYLDQAERILQIGG